MSTTRSARPTGRTTQLEQRRLAKPAFSATGHFDLDVPETFFTAAVARDSIPHVASFRWSTDVKALDDVAPLALASHRGRGCDAVLLELDDILGAQCLVYAHLCGGVIRGNAASFGRETVREAEEWLRRRVPVSAPTADRQVPVRFWTASQPPRMLSRKLVMPAWSEIATNYPSAARSELDRLLAPEFRPASAGQLILWHGPPGTGKTHALRALAWEWREWCEVHYVTDPESFFGAASYMLQVLLRETNDDEDANEEDSRWRILVLEDTGELLAADAKERTGQGLSRLLNVVDGVIGQGLRVLVLVTTNEELRRLHPAVSRPGRCAAIVEFGAFGPGEARAWLEKRGSNGQPGRATLAELFACLGGRPVPDSRGVGFAPP